MSRHKQMSYEFEPESYELQLPPNETAGPCRLTIRGKRHGKPSQRFTLHQKNLKVLSAVVLKQYKSEEEQLPVERINHLSRAEQVRLHLSQKIYPGTYELQLTYKMPPEQFYKLTHMDDPDDYFRSHSFREMIPGMDEEIRTMATYKISSQEKQQ